VLICCKRKVLLTGCWLVADVDLVREEKKTAGWLADMIFWGVNRCCLLISIFELLLLWWIIPQGES